MNWARANILLRRGLKLRCPACGEGALFRSPFGMNDHCSYCGYVFTREQGYFVGAIYINTVVTESLIIAGYLIAVLLSLASDERVYYLLFAIAVITPIAFYHHSKSLWLSLDYLIDPPEKPAR